MTRKKYRPQRDDSMLGDPYSQDDSTPQLSIVVSTVGSSAPAPAPAPTPSSTEGSTTRHVPVSHSDDEGNVIVDVAPTTHNHFNPIVPIVPNVPVVIHELEEAGHLPTNDGSHGDVDVASENTGSHDTDVCPDCIETAATLSNGATATATATATASTGYAAGAADTSCIGVTTSTAVVAKIVDDVVNNVIGVGVGASVGATTASAQPSPANKWTRFKTWFLACLSCSCCCQRKRRTSVQLK